MISLKTFILAGFEPGSSDLELDVMSTGLSSLVGMPGRPVWAMFRSMGDCLPCAVT
jgi:hypothetical protein